MIDSYVPLYLFILGVELEVWSLYHALPGLTTLKAAEAPMWHVWVPACYNIKLSLGSKLWLMLHDGIYTAEELWACAARMCIAIHFVSANNSFLT